MKMSMKIVIVLLLMQCIFTQIAFGDIVVQKDAIGPGAIGGQVFGALLLTAAGIVVIWAISIAVIKAVRNKNVRK